MLRDEMLDLIARITQRLAERKFCTIFQHRLEEYFPFKPNLDPDWVAAVNKFAADNGWEVKIVAPAVRVVFRKKNVSGALKKEKAALHAHCT